MGDREVFPTAREADRVCRVRESRLDGSGRASHCCVAGLHAATVASRSSERSALLPSQRNTAPPSWDASRSNASHCRSPWGPSAISCCRPGHLMLQAWTRDAARPAAEPAPPLLSGPGTRSPAGNAPDGDIANPPGIPKPPTATSSNGFASRLRADADARPCHRPPRRRHRRPALAAQYPATLDSVHPVHLLARTTDHVHVAVYVAQTALPGETANTDPDGAPCTQRTNASTASKKGADGQSDTRRRRHRNREAVLFHADDYLVVVEYAIANATSTESRARLCAQLRRDATAPGRAGKRPLEELGRCRDGTCSGTPARLRPSQNPPGPHG